MTAVDWSRYRKCPACLAALGTPCLRISGDRWAIADRPHSTRKLRTGKNR